MWRSAKSTLCWVALLTSALPTRAQLPADPAEPSLPEYRIEVIVFANTEFSSAEEDFSHRDAAGPGMAPFETPAEIPSLPSLPFLEELVPDVAEAGAPPLGTASDPAPTGPVGTAAPAAQGTPPANPAPATLPFRFRLLEPEDLELNNAHASLRRLPAYMPLLHGGWIQEGLPPEQAHRFDLSLLGVTNVRGSIELYLSRFLHIDLDLTYQQSVSPVAGGTEALEEFSVTPRYRLRAERRLRSGELHYFDHPAFGVLLLVRPLPPAASGAQAPAA